MTTTYAVLDLETTGSSYRRGERIIQIGIAFVEDGKIIRTYNRLINPLKEIPLAITQLTGIREEDVRNQPTFAEIADEVWNQLTDTVIVAHNIQFDFNFLEQSFEALDYPKMDNKGIDTVELIRIFYPTASSYKLSNFSKTYQIVLEQAHSALDDAKATAIILIKVQQKVFSLPETTFDQMKPFLHLLLRETGYFIYQWYMQKKELQKVISQVTLDGESEGCQEADFGVSSLVTQSKLSLNSVQKAIIQDFSVNDSNSDLRLLSAPSGSGKTLATLIACLSQGDQQIVYATSTTVLQYQIQQQTIPMLVAYLGKPIKVALLKSSNHFINVNCFNHLLKTFNKAIHEISKQDAMISLAILVWLTKTETGDFAELHHSLRLTSYWSVYNEMKEKLTDYETRTGHFYQQQLMIAQSADIILVNHAYLSEHRSELLRLPVTQLLIDECHRFSDTLLETTATKISVTYYQKIIENLLQVFTQLSDRFLLQSRDGELSEKYYLLQEDIQTLALIIDGFSFELSTAYTDRYYQNSTEINIYLPYEEANKQVWWNHLGSINKISRHVIKQLQVLLASDKLKLNQLTVKRWRNILQEAMDANEKINELLQIADENYMTLIIKSDGKDTYDYLLTKNRYDQNRVVKDWLLQWKIPIILMSASVKQMVDNKRVESLFGITDYIFYDYIENFSLSHPVVGRVLTDGLSVEKLNTADSSEKIALLLVKFMDIMDTCNKKVHVIFQSKKLIRATYDYLHSYYPNLTNKYVVAQLEGRSFKKIYDQYNQLTTGILLGMHRFNEGIHFDELSDIYLLTRLPFPNPKNVTELAYKDWLEVHNQDYFSERALPEMLTRLNQIIGRSGRNGDKTTLFLSLDQRIIKSQYKKDIQQAVPFDIIFEEITEQTVLRFLKDD